MEVWSISSTKATISALEYLKQKKTLYDPKGIEIAGDYWETIKNDIKQRCGGNISRGTSTEPGRVAILFTSQIEAYLAECKDRLDMLEKQEEDRALDHLSKNKGIKYSKIAIIISIIALIISAISLFNQQYIVFNQ